MPLSCSFCRSESLVIVHSKRKLFWKILRSYYRCEQCSGFTLIPKLGPVEVNELYDEYYLEDSFKEETLAHSGLENWNKKYKLTIKYLRSQKVDSKNLLDFGCGVDGYGIQVAREMGLSVSGLEVSVKTRTIIEATMNCKIFSPEELQTSLELFDFILLSDVIEHVTEPSLILEQAIQHLAENGVLIIQGPLEGTRNFINLYLSIYSFLTPTKVSNILPYHVSLANKQSIESLLSANALNIEMIHISETWWPVPKSFSSYRLLLKASPQLLAKFLDFGLSLLLPNHGTRFWLIATKKEGR